MAIKTRKTCEGLMTGGVGVYLAATQAQETELGGGGARGHRRSGNSKSWEEPTFILLSSNYKLKTRIMLSATPPDCKIPLLLYFFYIF